MRPLLIAALVLAALPALSRKATDPTGPFAKKLKPDQAVEHALSRMTFGARPGDVEHIKKMGLEKWIAQQLDPGTIEGNAKLTERLALLDTWKMTPAELAQSYPPPQVLRQIAEGKAKPTGTPEQQALQQRLADRYKARAEGKPEPEMDERTQRMRRAAFFRSTPEQRREALKQFAPQQVIAYDLNEAKLLRAVMSERQLEEVLTDFWFNHFNVYYDKGADRWLTTSYERDAIRPHVMGKFSDLVRATASHPAMLFYLDNWQSMSPDAGKQLERFTRGKVKGRGLNENYGRELLELHTLGVDGGYSQQDVIEAARCFTGWTLRNPQGGASFHFDERMHDKGEKTVLGVKIPAGGGKEDGMRVIEIVSRHPSTARYIARRLAQRFVADEPPNSLVLRLAEVFTKTDGDLKAVYRALFASREFLSQGAYKAKMKSPLEYVASAVRATGAEIGTTAALAQQIAEMGQPLYRKVEPTGYSNSGEEWTSTSGLLARLNFATAMKQNKVPGLKAQNVALDLGAPEFQRR